MNSDEVHRKIFTGVKKQIIVSLHKRIKNRRLFYVNYIKKGMVIMKNYELRNGVRIPEIGYGTWKTPDGETCAKAVETAIKLGYRHIDAAMVYGNEESVGLGIKNSGIRREELFLTGKVWNTDRGYGRTIRAFEKTIKDLQTDYLDLYLIHWPASPNQYDCWEALNRETWEALTDLYKSGKVKAIGVSNFRRRHLTPLLEAEVIPMVNQLELHPGMVQADIVSLCSEYQILPEAYSPLGNGKLLKSKELSEMAERYGKTPAQICIKWNLQHGFLPLSKSVNEDRMRTNLEVHDFKITEEDMRALDGLEGFADGNDPDQVLF